MGDQLSVKVRLVQLTIRGGGRNTLTDGINGKMGIGDNLQEDTQSSKPASSVMEPENPSNKEEISDRIERIERIYSLAKEGKTDYGTFVVGKTSHSEVTDILGEPSSKTDSNHSIYEDYPKQYITIGYQNDTVTDFRTRNEGVKKVHYNVIMTLSRLWVKLIR